MRGTIEERLWAKVDRRGPDECWVWRGATNLDGYGRILESRTVFGVRAPTRQAHQISWELHNGRPVPAELLVLHTCDNPPCCNPKHLFLGTNADNMKDMAIKGRSNRTLTEDEVLDIRSVRSMGARLEDIAAAFGVSIGLVSMIARGIRWSHIRAGIVE